MSGTSPLEERISIYLFGRSRVGAAIPKVVTIRKSAGKHIFVVCPPGSTPAPPSTPHGRCYKSCTGGQTFFQSSSGKVPAARCRCRVRRQGAAAGCARQCPYGGRAGGRYRQSSGRSQSHLRGPVLTTLRAAPLVPVLKSCYPLRAAGRGLRHGH